jgi:outer membrane receptor for ferrienterochelin and colicins
MRTFIIAMIMAMTAVQLHAQHNLTVKVTDGKQPLHAATITITPGGYTAITDSAGQAKFTNLNTGSYDVLVSFIGYATASEKVTIATADVSIRVSLEASEEEEEEEVIIQSTRTSRTIGNVPTRVETIDLEEINEKNNMRPANVAMLLHESTGIQVQQTSATSGNAGIRIQGLDGRYTQLLKDGFANYGNFASGLSVLEIPPLDLEAGGDYQGTCIHTIWRRLGCGRYQFRIEDTGK